GPIGMLTMLAAKAAGATTLFLSDVNDERLAFARRIMPGVTTINPTRDDVGRVVRDGTEGKVGCVFRRVVSVDALGFARHEGAPIHGLVDKDRYERRQMPETFESLDAVRVESTAPISKQVDASALAPLLPSA
ncbi:hypothetical protein QCF01_18225, partial [Staphylococcus aureus]|nr:hypothetical protein [Staphylococcus aureus]